MSGVSEYGASGMGQGSKFGILSAYEDKSMRLLESDTLKTFFIRFISFPWLLTFIVNSVDSPGGGKGMNKWKINQYLPQPLVR